MYRPFLLCLTLMVITILFTSIALADPPAKSAPAVAAPPTTAPAPKSAPPSTDPEVLRKLIEERLKKEWSVNPPTTQPAKPRVKPSSSSMRKPAPSAQLGAAQAPRKPTLEQQSKEKGCGGAGDVELNLDPPPLDQPQPRWACDEPIVEIKPVWSGSSAVFVFNIRNDGEGVLNLRLRGG